MNFVLKDSLVQPTLSDCDRPRGNKNYNACSVVLTGCFVLGIQDVIVTRTVQAIVEIH
jgi:hypothetical protein